MRAVPMLVVLALALFAFAGCRESVHRPAAEGAATAPAGQAEAAPQHPEVPDFNITPRMRMYAGRIEQADGPVARLNALNGLAMQLSTAQVQGRPVTYASALRLMGRPDAWIDDPEFAAAYLLEGDWEAGGVVMVFNSDGTARLLYNQVDVIDAAWLKKPGTPKDSGDKSGDA